LFVSSEEREPSRSPIECHWDHDLRSALAADGIDGGAELADIGFAKRSRLLSAGG
jgi:hypothetical protein